MAPPFCTGRRAAITRSEHRGAVLHGAIGVWAGGAAHAVRVAAIQHAVGHGERATVVFVNGSTILHRAAHSPQRGHGRGAGAQRTRPALLPFSTQSVMVSVPRSE